MTYQISDDCVMCGMCVTKCSVDAIYQGETQYHINQDVCIGCGFCRTICPVGAPEQT